MKINTIYVLGDICTRWNNTQQFDSDNTGRVFNELKELVKDADLIVANLESPVTNSNKKLNKNSVNLKAEPTDISVLKDFGINGVALANNHILDYDIKGLEDTLDICDKLGIFYYGAGTKEEAAKPYFVQLNGIKIGILAFAEQEFNCAVDYGKGANLWDDLDGIKSIKLAKQECDYLIVQYHGGIEHYEYPSPDLQKRCRFMCEAGADFVTCQHSHCIGTRENYNGAEILYGQGNSIFGYREKNNSWNQGLIAKIEISDTVKITYIPITASITGEHLINDVQANEILELFNKKSENVLNPVFLNQSWIEFCNKKKDEYFPMIFSWNRVFNKLNRLSKGKIIELFTSNKNRRNAMNIIRCNAHREVIKTIFENDFYA